MKKFLFSAKCAALSAIILVGTCLTAAAQSVTPVNTASQTCNVVPSQTGMQYTYNPGTSGLTLLSWAVLGDLTAGTIAGNTITVNSTAGNGKGRVQANLSNCTSQFYDVFKSFTVTDNIVGPTCPAAGSPVAYTINPSVSTTTQINAGIGIDTYTWTANGSAATFATYGPVYSGDKSAVTFNMPSASFTLGVTVGSCNLGKTPTRERTLALTAGLPAITFAAPLPSTCRSVYDNSSFVLTLASSAPGATYTFSGPSGWNIVPGTVGGQPSATITPTNANSGDIVVTGILGGGAANSCNSRTAVYHIDRQLEQSGTTKNYISPLTGCYSAGTNTTYTFTLNGLIPGGNPLTWTVPTGWTITSANGGSIITAVPGATAISGDITVKTACQSVPVTLAVTVSGAVTGCDYSVSNLSNSFFPHQYGAGATTGNTCSATGNVYTWRLLSSTGTVLEGPIVRNHPTNTYQFTYGGGAAWPSPGYTVEVRVENSANCLNIVRTALNQQLRMPASGAATSSTTKNEASLVTGGVHVFPNPSSDVVNIELPEAAKGVADVTISDALGRVQQRLTTTANWTPVSVAKLPTGSYLVRVQLPDGTRTTQTLLVSH